MRWSSLKPRVICLFLCAAVFAALVAPTSMQADQQPAVSPKHDGRTVLGSTPWDPGRLRNAKVIYGADDRIDVYEETDPDRLQWAKSVCALMDASDLTDNGDGTFTIATYAYSYWGYPPCPGEPFAGQPTAAYCSGVLVGDDLIATAGHCYDTPDLLYARFVFGFIMEDAVTPITVVDQSQVYSGVEVVAHALDAEYDYAVVRVDRPVTAPGARPLEIRRDGVIPNGTQIGVMGFPSGLPLKIAFGGQTVVMDNAYAGFFIANLDTYGGNSGSPVFNAATGVVEGILVRGAQDFVVQGSCFVSNVLDDAEGAEDSSKTTTFADFVPELVTSQGFVGLDRTHYTCSDSVAVIVRDGDLAGGTADAVIATSGGDSETLVLTEETLGSGWFDGALSLNDDPVAVENGAVNAGHGQTITATYYDADDGTGAPAVADADAVVDCVPPAIANVVATDILTTFANIEFTTDEEAAPRVRYGTACGSLTSSAWNITSGTSHNVVLTGLDPATPYFFAVEATDVAGNLAFDDNGGSCYAFTTADHVDYFTEYFDTNTFDLDNTTLVFTPDGSASSYALCSQPATAFPTNPDGGDAVALSDDGHQQVFLNDGASVSLYGTGYDSFYVGSNGYITFAAGDTTFYPSLGTHFALPRIAPLFTDFDPTLGGRISWKQLTGRVVVTYENVPEYGLNNANNFQVEMSFDGTIALTFLRVDASEGLTGLSRGFGIPADYALSDLSSYGPCEQYTLTYTAGPNGSIVGDAIQTVAPGEDGAPVEAVPDEGCHFVQWSDGSTENPRTDTNVVEDLDVAATFAINEYTLTYTAGPNGAITGDAAQTVAHGGNGTPVEAVPDEGYHFVQWSDGSTKNPRTDTNVTEDIAVTAVFTIYEYTLTYTAGPNGSVTGETTQTVAHGEDGAPVEAVPDEGYHFVQWSDGSTDNPRTDTNVTEDIAVTANFAINEYTLTYTAGPNGSLTGETTQTVAHGEDGAPVEAVPDEDYHFVQWSDGSTDNPRTDTNVAASLEVAAQFAVNTGALQVVIEPAQAIDAGAQWRLVGAENWRNSGYVQTGIPVGVHAVEFKVIPAWNAPETMNVAIIENETALLTAEYLLQFGSLLLTIEPLAAVAAGAQWRIEGGPWQNSGAALTGLKPGVYWVSFSDVPGWSKPVPMKAVIVGNETSGFTAIYAQQLGALRVNIEPPDAVDAGARWRLVGGAWQNSGETMPDLPIGNYTVEFKPGVTTTMDTGGCLRAGIEWETPPNQTVTIQTQQTTETTGTYTSTQGF